MSIEKLLEVLDYCPETGVFKWKKSVAKKIKAGDVAGYVDEKGHVCITYKLKKYRAHRLVWYIHYGELPKRQLDHIDSDRQNNRITNLKEVDKVRKPVKLGRVFSLDPEWKILSEAW